MIVQQYVPACYLLIHAETICITVDPQRTIRRIQFGIFLIFYSWTVAFFHGRDCNRQMSLIIETKERDPLFIISDLMIELFDSKSRFIWLLETHAFESLDQTYKQFYIWEIIYKFIFQKATFCQNYTYLLHTFIFTF